MADARELDPEILVIKTRLEVAAEIVAATAEQSKRVLGRLTLSGTSDELLALTDLLTDYYAVVDEAARPFHDSVRSGSFVDEDHTENDEDLSTEEIAELDEDDVLIIEDDEPEVAVAEEFDEGESIVRDEEAFLEWFLDYLRSEIAYKGLTEEGYLRINIGQIAREMNDGENLPKDKFHELVQWIKSQPFLISYEQGYLTFDVPGETQRFAISLSPALLDQLYELIMGSPSLSGQLHINQICNLLNVSKEDKTQLVQLLSEDERFEKISGSKFAVAATTILPKPKAPEVVAPSESIDIDAVLGCITIPTNREIAIRCLGDGGKMITLRGEVPFIAELNDKDYDAFKDTTFPVIKDQIVEQLRAAGYEAHWEVTGRTRATRHKLVIGKPHTTQDTETVSGNTSVAAQPHKQTHTQRQDRVRRSVNRPERVKTTEHTGHSNGVQIVNEAHVREAGQNIRHIVPAQGMIKGSELLRRLAAGRVSEAEAQKAIIDSVANGSVMKVRQKGSVFYQLTVGQ